MLFGNIRKSFCFSAILFYGCRKVFDLRSPTFAKNISETTLKNKTLNGVPEKIDKMCVGKYVSESYAFDRNLPIRMAPHLTDKHLDVPSFTSIHVNFTAQVLSHSVAAGIHSWYSCHLGKLQRDAEHTAKFIDIFDKICNTRNSQTIKSLQPMGHATSNGSGHFVFFQDILTYSRTLKPARSRKELPCISGWQIHELWKNLCAEKKCKFLLTSRC